jgi:opacity protein-like surface antigen
MLYFLKNKLLTILLNTTIILYPFCVFADQGPYFKGLIGMNKFNRIKNFNDFRQNSNFSPEIGVGGGIGFNFDKTFRGELIVIYTKVNFHNHCNLNSFYDTHLNTKRVTINSTMFNIYKDFFEVTKNVNFFGGVGIGISQINESITWKVFYPDIRNRRNIKVSKGATHRKNVYNFSYSLMAGMDFEVSEKLNIELGYQFKNLGITKPKTMQVVYLDGKTYISHNIYTGIRYNL